MAHVDYLKPWPVDVTHSPDQVTVDPPIVELSTATQCTCDNSVPASALVPLADDPDHDSDQDPHNTIGRPQRSRRPPRQLLEELP